MKKSSRALVLLMTVIFTLSVILSSCTPKPDDPAGGGGGGGGPAGPEYTEELIDGYNQLTLYWNYEGSYEDCDVWAWWDGKEGQGYLFHECEYGAKAIINVPEGITEVGFIVRRGCSEPGGTSWGTATKDYESDRFAVLEGRETKIYLKKGVGDQFTSDDGGKTLVMIKKINLVGIVDKNKIKYSITPKTLISSLDGIKITEGDNVLEIESLTSLGKSSASGTVTLAEDIDLSKSYSIEIEGYGKAPVVPTSIFDSAFFAENYHYDGDDLGATINGDTTTFKVWAPTASKVILNLFEAGNGVDAYANIEMTRGERGVWSHTADCGHGTYYTYTVTTSVGTQEAVDPYAKAAGVNGNRGMVVDLDSTDPEGWESADFENPITDYSDAVIWEVHVRDFSNKIEGSQYRGKYLAFTERGLVNEHGIPVGVDYLRELGITHVHLLPVYDYATVDESDPDSGFNWGYDPKNYNVPEGSYSTDPFNGAVRINEFKRMVQALHAAGIGVIMDVVYNHTYDANSSFNRIVPYYYYRYTSTGANSSASGCGNDTASERYMYNKFMTESTSYWVSEYKLDGLRFDLMGLHDMEAMQSVESAVHTVNPKAIIYGEGWTMGSTIDGSPQANQGNIGGIIPTGDAIGGISVFNDVIRDGLKGSVFESGAQGFISGAFGANLNRILFGIKGGDAAGFGWQVKNGMVINYMSAHDNNTLWDKLMLSNGDDTVEDRIKMNKLGAAILMVSRGTPFWQAGEEMLRTKGGDENSYKSPDSVNNIDWSVLSEDSNEYKTMLYYKGLIEMRKRFDIFSDTDVVVTHTQIPGGGVAIKIADGEGGEALVVINAGREELSYTAEGQWYLVADGERAGSAVLAEEQGTLTVGAISVKIYVNGALITG